MKTRTLTILARFGLMMVGLLLLAGALLAAGESSGPLAMLAAFLITFITVLSWGRRLNQVGALSLGGDSLQRLYTMKLTHTVAVTVGQIVVIGGRVVEACGTYGANAEGVYIYQGKRLWPKEAALAVAAWAEVYWDATNNVVTATVAGNTPIGFCCEAAASADTSIVFQLLPIAVGAITPPAMKACAEVALADQALLLTATQMIDGAVLKMTPGAARNIQSAVAADLVAGCKGAKVGTWFEFTVISLAAFAVTITTNTGITLIGNMAANNASARFRAVFTNVTSGAEAVSIYRAS